jgi:hypothetical protein
MTQKGIISEFKDQFGYLEKYGLRISGLGQLLDDYVISVSTPLIFDHRKLPKKFMGLDVRNGCSELPKEFENIDNKTQYIWAYQRFELCVDNNLELIRDKLESPNMSREEALDAICFGDFLKHKEHCIKWEKEGRIPKYK